MISKNTRALRCIAMVLLAMAVTDNHAMAQQAERRPLYYFDWGAFTGTNPGIRDAVSVIQKFDAETRTMTYLTGGSALGSDGRAASRFRNQAAPARVAALESVGQVTVQVWATDDGASAQESQQYAEWLARAAHLVTTGVWPAAAVPVIVDVYLMDEDVPYSRARRVEWVDGEPLSVVIFSSDLRTSYPRAIHELYHLLAARWVGGFRDPQLSAAYNRAFAFDEVVAHLYARCASLVADGALDRPNATFTVILNGRSIGYPPLQPPDLEYILDLLTRSEESDENGWQEAAQFGSALREIPVLEIFGEESLIALDSPEGQELISLCREVGPDPMRMESWFKSLLPGP